LKSAKSKKALPFFDSDVRAMFFGFRVNLEARDAIKKARHTCSFLTGAF